MISLLMSIFKNYIREENNVVPNDKFQLFDSHLKSLSFTESSSVFSIKEKTEMVDTNIRLSRTIHDNDIDLLKFVDTYLINTLRNRTKLSIKRSRDYVTFIKYEKGGFFSPHTDFEKYKLNDSCEMHLLFCLVCPDDGGELKIDNNKYIFEQNKCIMFDKHMLHSAEIVKDGIKIIMSIDVLVNIDLLTKISDLDILDKFKNGETDYLTTSNYNEFDNMLKLLGNAKYAVPFIMIFSTNSDNCVYVDGDGLVRYSVSENKKYKVPKYYKLNGALIDVIGMEDLEFQNYVCDEFENFYCLMHNVITYNKKLLLAQVKWLYSNVSSLNYKSDIVSASYHCNEPSYDTWEVNIVGGFIRTNVVPTSEISDISDVSSLSSEQKLLVSDNSDTE